MGNKRGVSLRACCKEQPSYYTHWSVWLVTILTPSVLWKGRCVEKMNRRITRAELGGESVCAMSD